MCSAENSTASDKSLSGSVNEVSLRPNCFNNNVGVPLHVLAILVIAVTKKKYLLCLILAAKSRCCCNTMPIFFD